MCRWTFKARQSSKLKRGDNGKAPKPTDTFGQDFDLIKTLKDQSFGVMARMSMMHRVGRFINEFEFHHLYMER